MSNQLVDRHVNLNTRFEQAIAQPNADANCI